MEEYLHPYSLYALKQKPIKSDEETQFILHMDMLLDCQKDCIIRSGANPMLEGCLTDTEEKCLRNCFIRDMKKHSLIEPIMRSLAEEQSKML